MNETTSIILLQHCKVFGLTVVVAQFFVYFFFIEIRSVKLNIYEAVYYVNECAIFCCIYSDIIKW
jgi:hypothetical protein